MKNIIVAISCLWLSLLVKAQNVGIGTLTPTDAKLEIHEPAGNTQFIAGAGADLPGISTFVPINAPSIGFNARYQNGYKFMGAGHGGFFQYSPSLGRLYYYYSTSTGVANASMNSTLGLSIDSSGQLGIGTTSQRAKLHVVGNVVFVGSASIGLDTEALGIASTTMGNNTIARAYGSLSIGQFNDSIVTSSTTNWVTTDPVFIIGNGTADNARSNALTFLKNGNMGLSTSAPQYGLHVVNNNFQDGGHVQGIMVENISSGANIGEAAISFKNQSFLNPNAKWTFGLNQNPSMSWDYGTSFGGSAAMVLDTTGNLTILGILTQSSDARLKKSIHPLQNSLQKILRLNGYQYNWIESSRDKSLQTGVLAQEVEQQMPELVKTNTEGMKTVNYSGMIPYLIEAIKELKEENSLMKKEIEQLKRQLK